MVRHYTGFDLTEEVYPTDGEFEDISEEDLWAALEEAKNIVGTSGPHVVGASFIDEISIDISSEVASAISGVLSDEYLIDNASDENSHLYSNISVRINEARSLEEIVTVSEYLLSRVEELTFTQSDISKLLRRCYRLYGDKKTVEMRGKEVSDLTEIELSGSSYYLDLHPKLTLENMKEIAHIMLQRIQYSTHRNQTKKAA